ncbi:MAG: VOC family protein [Anaerolineae bacterium]
MNIPPQEQQRIGTVYLRVKNLQDQLDFYQRVIGLQVHRQDGATVYLGTGGADLLALIDSPQGVRRRGSNGLFHFALLVPTRADLARAVYHLMRSDTRLQGASDHIVSEALYLSDPEGNGIEIYADRPRQQWYREGKFQLGTLPLDLNDLMQALPSRTDDTFTLAERTIMGHIHLHVDQIAPAVDFYRDVLGMQVMMQLSSAAFLSYDGYHHHVGINVWAGQVQHSADTLGLDHATLFLDADERQHLPDPDILSISDPAANLLHLDNPT